MLEVPVTPLAATIDKTGVFKLGNELTDLAGHRYTLPDTGIRTSGKRKRWFAGSVES